MNIDVWRSRLMREPWLTPDIDSLSLSLSGIYRQNKQASILLPCGQGIGLSISCEKQQDAMQVLADQGYLSFAKGQLTDGCCFSYDRIELLEK